MEVKSLKYLSAISILKNLHQPVLIGRSCYISPMDIREYSISIVFLPIPYCLKVYLLEIYLYTKYGKYGFKKISHIKKN